MRLKESQLHILSWLESGKPIVPKPTWHTNSIASLIRKEYIKQVGSKLQITPFGKAALKYTLEVKYENWLSTLHNVSLWRKKK